MKLTHLFTLTIILFSGITILAQKEVDVRSMEILRQNRGETTTLTVKAINSAGAEVMYREADTGFIEGAMDFERCVTCRAPQLFTANPFGFSNPAIAELNNLTNHYLRFYIESSSSDLLYLNQRDMIRKSGFFKYGIARVTGRLEVFNNDLGAIVAYDNDVVLEGRYSVRFGKPYFPLGNGGRWVDQLDSVFILSETRAQVSQSQKTR